MRIEKRTMGWLPKSSTWDYQQRINKWQHARAKTYLAETSATASAFAAVRYNLASGQAELAAKAALSRVVGKTPTARITDKTA
jgi:hypothetical protein